MGHTDFASAFRAGARFQERTILYAIEVFPAGEITTTGPLTLFDPVPDELGGYGRIPYAREVPAGTYAVEVAIARNEKHPDSAPIAAIRVRLTTGVACRWEVATLAGEGDPKPWGQDPGVYAQAGTLALTSAPDMMFACEPLTGDAWETFEGTHDQTVIVFDVEQHDYPAYWGFDEGGALCELCIDAGVLTRAVWRDVQFSLPLRPEEIAARQVELAEPARVQALLKGPHVLVLRGDVRRFWYGRVVDAAGREIGGSFAPRPAGKGADFTQTYDCAPYVAHGAVGLRVRMVLPDEPLAPLPAP